MKKCGLSWCDRLFHARGLCRPHYRQLRRGSKFQPVTTQEKICDVAGCDRLLQSRGKCNAHSARARRGQRLGYVRHLRFKALKGRASIYIRLAVSDWELLKDNKLQFTTYLEDLAIKYMGLENESLHDIGM